MDLKLGIETRGNGIKQKNVTLSRYNLCETWPSMDPSNESSESNRRNSGELIDRCDSGDQSDQRNRVPDSQRERFRTAEVEDN